jgi:DNA-binding transcriptional ArsR family regulator
VVGVVIGDAAEDVRRLVGPTAWCALEVLATMPPNHVAEAWIVRGSVRELARRLGISKNTAQRALIALRQVGLVKFAQQRDGRGRFGDSSYDITVPDDVLRRQRPSASVPSRGSDRAGSVAGRRSVARPPARASVEQLVLLPGD